jgi:hypothetical protein
LEEEKISNGKENIENNKIFSNVFNSNTWKRHLPLLNFIKQIHKIIDLEEVRER